MKGIIQLVYFLIKFLLAAVFFIPTLVIYFIIDFLNKDGNFDEVINDIKSFLNWLLPGSGF